jgi:hypothetical protein
LTTKESNKDLKLKLGKKKKKIEKEKKLINSKLSRKKKFLKN